MNKLYGVLLLVLAVIFGIIGTLQIIAAAENILGGAPDMVFLIKRVAISFVVLVLMYRTFNLGKSKMSGATKTEE